MSNVEYLPELAAALDRLVPAEEGLIGDWDDVVDRVHRRAFPVGRPGCRRPRLRLVLVLAASVVLLLAGIATAAYLLIGGPGRLTVIGGSGPVASVVGLDQKGRVSTIWRCPHNRFCGDLVSVAWAPDGRHLAVSVGTIAAVSLYDGVHIINVSTGADRQLPSPPRTEAPTKAARMQANVKLFEEEQRIFGCASPRYLAWSPDGRWLAYVCDWFPNGAQRALIYTIRPDGTGRRRLRTGTIGAYWPSWSPDGTQIAFSTGLQSLGSAIYTIDLDGSHKHLVARGAAPDWSPDGTTIAYRAVSCVAGHNTADLASIRLATPAGQDITPRRLEKDCELTGPYLYPVPAWSPDGHQLAINTGNGLYLVNRDGTNLRETASQAGGGVFGQDRPAWQPQPQRGSR
jgi:hypothetical protein